MRESAQPGHYLVLQSDDLKFRFVWKAGNDTIKIKYCGLLHFIKENRFDDETWNYSVQSFVRENEQNTDVCVTPLPGKETFRKISQNRHFASLKKKIFCCWCQMYQNELHLCSETEQWLHIDQTNLLFIHAKTRIEAARMNFWNGSGWRARTFTTRKDMLMQLYREAEDYWAAKERTKFQNWLNNQRKIVLQMHPQDWEHYIKQQWEQYLKEQYVKQPDVTDWISDINNLLCELRTIKWFEENKKNFENMEGFQIIDKFKKCIEAKELGDGFWLDKWKCVNEVPRNTLRSLIAAMEKERPPPQMSADAPKLVNDNCVKRTFSIR